MSVPSDSPRIAREDSGRVFYREPQVGDEPVTAAALRETVLQYVMRTRESIMLDDALAEPSFATYPYISGKRAC